MKHDETRKRRASLKPLLRQYARASGSGGAQVKDTYDRLRLDSPAREVRLVFYLSRGSCLLFNVKRGVVISFGKEALLQFDRQTEEDLFPNRPKLLAEISEALS